MDNEIHSSRFHLLVGKANKVHLLPFSVFKHCVGDMLPPLSSPSTTIEMASALPMQSVHAKEVYVALFFDILTVPSHPLLVGFVT